MGLYENIFANMLDNTKNECIFRILVGIHSKLLLVITNLLFKI
jgi:hypothetical protein